MFEKGIVMLRCLIEENRWVQIVLVAMGLNLLAMETSPAETIFEDQFDRTGTLDGSVPTTYDPDWFSTAPTWDNGGSTKHSTDGNVVLGVGSDSVALMPFKFETGYVYALEADVVVGGDHWAAIGFMVDDGSIDYNPAGGGESYFWMLQRPSNMTKAFPGVDQAGVTKEVATTDASSHLKIVLDTTQGAASEAMPWTVEWYNDSVSSNPDVPFHTYSWTSDLEIAGVFLAGFPTAADGMTVDNFALTAEVPEPSALAAICAAAIFGLLLRCRQKAVLR